ncbi:GNAT family N-acetyltransferase [Paenibacillus montanisoli]|uniref:GNAT family N-acetyltransferase n=1 Tax=Paenibacillus montanisoli TaxID=2081970 RepID=A0A328UAT3_9BACL|nr:GNAT family N-acetyltransferase [Paenibacillus montanisoli]RAP78035.1 GNAT family N-acetyltransferase [Paenibacillus montanisoli]
MTRMIEELTLNAWPSLQTVIYDGWLLRFADGYTKRSNSVSILGGDTGPEELYARIADCERIYTESGQDTIFKITPFGPSALDAVLERLGYAIADPSRVMIVESLDCTPQPVLIAVEFESSMSESWLETMCSMNGITGRNKALAARIMESSKQKQGYFTLMVDGSPAACGLGVIERGFIGLYDIVTAPSSRNQGYGEQLIRHMLHWARANGASKGYLQVVQSNGAANRLYQKLNYREIYRYWYRVKTRAYARESGC